MYNLRYHIASLVAVFLSLSIGLLLGTIVVERGTLDRQKEAIVQSLQEEFRSLDAANSELRERVSERDDFVDDLVPVAIEGVLDGGQVLVIAGTGRLDALAAVTEAIEAAGGVPVVLGIELPGFGLDDPAISQVVTETADPGPDDEGLLGIVVDTLAEEWTTADGERPLTARLLAAGALSAEGGTGSPDPVRGVVTISLLENGPEPGAIGLSQALSRRGIPVVGVEALTQPTGFAEAAVEAGLSGIDHLGSPEGTYSLVAVLSGRASGYFGVGDGAMSVWPR